MRGSWVRAPHIPLPVWVVGDIGGRDRDGVIVRVGVLPAGRWVAEVLDGNAGAALRVDSEETAQALEDAGAALGVFLWEGGGLAGLWT